MRSHIEQIVVDPSHNAARIITLGQYVRQTETQLTFSKFETLTRMALDWMQPATISANGFPKTPSVLSSTSSRKQTHHHDVTPAGAPR